MGSEEKRKARLESEYGEPWNPAKGGIRAALIYPNTYSVGMSNLGFQTVYHLLNRQDGVTCERLFLPDREEREKAGQGELPYRTLESGSRLETFDLLAFSVSFELDYFNVVEILRANGVPPQRRRRVYGRDPMVWIGGAAVSINPEPLADLADLMFIGEGEEVLPQVLHELLGEPVRDRKDFERFCFRTRTFDGVYFPHAYTFTYDSEGRVAGVVHEKGFPSRIKRKWVEDLDRFPTTSRILTPDMELNDMFLVELDRGCGRHCRFCAAGYIYRPPRFRSAASVFTSIEEGLKVTDRIGLVGTAVSDHPGLSVLVDKIRSRGGRISVSSLRADSAGPDLMAALAESGHKTISLAPEAGSQRLRDVINKGIQEQAVLDACFRALSARIMNLKLYFMVGLPTEQEEDLEALVELVLKIKEIQMSVAKTRGRIGKITVSLNPFVPKPHTPFQWFPMNKKDALSKKIGYIKTRLRKIGNVTVLHDLPKWAMIQALLAREGRAAGSLLCAVSERRGNWLQVLKEWGGRWGDSPFRTRTEDEFFPWEIVQSGFRKEYLYQEYVKSFSGRHTLPCPEDLACRRCGVCGEAEEGGS